MHVPVTRFFVCFRGTFASSRKQTYDLHFNEWHAIRTSDAGIYINLSIAAMNCHATLIHNFAQRFAKLTYATRTFVRMNDILSQRYPVTTNSHFVRSVSCFSQLFYAHCCNWKSIQSPPVRFEFYYFQFTGLTRIHVSVTVTIRRLFLNSFSVQKKQNIPK